MQLAEQERRLNKQRAETLHWRSIAKACDVDRVRELEDERDHRIRALARSERHLLHANHQIAQLKEELRESTPGASTVNPIAEPIRASSSGDREPQNTELICAYADGCAQGECNLGGCTVLYVGGEKRLIPHFRRLVSAANGSLLHHDGGIEDSLRTLPRLRAKADAILCPISKVGHMAVCHVKKTCSESCKPFIPLRRGSLEAFSSGLTENAGVTPPLVSHYFGTKERLFEAEMLRSIADCERVQAE